MKSSAELSPIDQSLDVCLLESPVLLERQENNVTRLWESGIQYNERCFRLYFDYYLEQCRIAFQSGRGHLPIRTHQHIINIANRMQSGCTRSTVKDFIEENQWTGEQTSDEAIDASMNLAARLLLMLDVSEFPNAYSGQKKLLWSEGLLQEFVKETLTESIPPAP
ncbi:uncharacterized protein NFIA_041200 [Aspergillus fischeri NRRL 181]|uniref:Uncharacterized protein n=1 Tax=Neosartorya fischeri (strain ATCC 1020 / DSM 3700 / CBS 544.65 / FGSC A1164 / JCM 1740 / NRRL 181 / WB 181) TaxID=331117 RepID=A1D0M2_NEOFI|nr:uncharacterized protein NFIA_041200 [Aspergillus fischeri NRRL 181]EAW24542.1 hypothetical protein NFIA_041200 [Aspergillus fischeri NRRL 181]